MFVFGELIQIIKRVIEGGFEADLEVAGLGDIATSVCDLSSRSRAFHSDADIIVDVSFFPDGRNESAWEINVIVFVLIGIGISSIPREVIKGFIGKDDLHADGFAAFKESGLVSRGVSFF